MLLGAAVHQVLTCFAQPLHGKRRPGAVAQQSLQTCAVMRFDAHAGVHREAAMFVAQHLFGLKALQQAPAHEGAQDAAAQGGLHLGHGGLINCTDWTCPVSTDSLEILDLLGIFHQIDVGVVAV